MFSFYNQLTSTRVHLNTVADRSYQWGGDMLLALPLGLTGSLSFLSTGSTDLVECARQKDYPITFPFSPLSKRFLWVHYQMDM